METKVCIKCKQELDKNLFNKSKILKDGLFNWCKKCQSEYKKNYYIKHKTHLKMQAKDNKEKIQQLFLSYMKDKSCVSCGETDIIVLEFDHINPKTKKNSISILLARHIPWKRIEEEIKKCQILCANCHKRKTAREQNSFRYRSKHNKIKG